MIVRLAVAIAVVEIGTTTGFETGGHGCMIDSSSGWSARCFSPGLTGLEVDGRRGSITVLGDVSRLDDGFTCITSSSQLSDSEVLADSGSVVVWGSSVGASSDREVDAL